MRRPIVAGNWKMNGTREGVDGLIADILGGLDGSEVAEVVVCPPFVYLPQVADKLTGTQVSWGGQTLNPNASGAYTGDVSGSMLTGFGCKYVIVGHSERRDLFGESSEDVAERFMAAQRENLIPILCVGEHLEDREAGKTETVIAAQLDAVIQAAGAGALANAVIAYEPVWAIGTGVTATTEQAQEVHAFIRGRVAVQDAGVAEGLRILYGGSVKPGNAADLFSMTDIDGGLIGGASLKADDFLPVCRAAG